MNPGEPSRPPLEILADAVADLSDVDWNRERSAPETDDGLLRALEVISHMSRATEETPSGKPALEPLPDGTVVPPSWGSIRLESVIGRGAFGTVFQARDLLLDQDVALKVLHPGGAVVGRLIDEGRRLARLRHPNIVNVICIDEHEELIGLRMELLRGQTLAEVLWERGTFDEGETLDAGLQVGRALAAVHAAGVIHRDVKAHNVMRDETGRVVLMDLGAGTDYDTGVPSATRGVVGTPVYLAPEVLEGEPATPCSDVYSLGVLLYLLVSADYPVRAASIDELRETFRGGQMIPLAERCPDLSTGFLDLVERATAKDPAVRYSTADDMVAAVSTLIASREESLQSEATPPTLPMLLTRFVGRERELAQVLDLVREERVVTLTGAGGCGKTRTALEVAWKAHPSFSGGTWLVELASIDSPDLVTQAVLERLGAKGTPSQPPVDVLIGFLGDRRALLVLDNCEHLTTGCAELVLQIVTRTAHVHVLATSREALKVPGEMTYLVAPLATPTIEDEASLDRFAAVESVKLFADRARAANAQFSVLETNAADIARICRRVDGIPLAIELAAVQVMALPLGEIARRIEDEFLTLGEGVAARLPHQQTVRTLISWSYDLLTRTEQALFRRAAVFSGGWTGQAAEATCVGEGVEAADLAGLHFQLVSKSLISLDQRPEPGTGSARYRMLDAIREFAGDRLQAEDEIEVTRRRHRDHFMAVAGEARVHYKTAETRTWNERVRVDHDNFQAALRHCMDDPGDSAPAIELVNCLRPYWMSLGYWREAELTFQELMTRPDLRSRTASRSKLLSWIGTFAAHRSDVKAAAPPLEESLSIARELGDTRMQADALGMLGTVHWHLGDHEAARTSVEEAVDMLRKVGPERALGSALSNLGIYYMELGDHDAAVPLYNEALEIQRRAGNRAGEAQVLHSLAELAHGEESALLFKESLAIFRELDHTWAIALTLSNLANTMHQLGHAEEARAMYVECLPILQKLDARSVIITSLEGYAALVAGQSDPHRAARLLGAAAAMREETNFAMKGTNREAVSLTMSTIDESLGEETREMEYSAGLELSTAEAIDLALDRTPATPEPPTDPP